MVYLPAVVSNEKVKKKLHIRKQSIVLELVIGCYFYLSS